jgi:hypothetical protein
VSKKELENLTDMEESEKIVNDDENDVVGIDESGGTDITVVKNEVSPIDEEVSVEETIERLDQVSSFVKDRFNNDLQCLLLYDEHQMPFLSVN